MSPSVHSHSYSATLKSILDVLVGIIILESLRSYMRYQLIEYHKQVDIHYRSSVGYSAPRSAIKFHVAVKVFTLFSINKAASKIMSLLTVTRRHLCDVSSSLNFIFMYLYILRKQFWSLDWLMIAFC
jgi:hypothetical protein